MCPGLWPGVGIECDFIANRSVARDQLGSAGIHDWLHEVVKDGRLFGLHAMIAPVLELGLAEQIARLLKSRHPSATVKPRVPADMVDVQVGAEHGIDAVGWKTGRGHVLKKWRFAVVPGRHGATFLVVAKSGVDDDPARGRLDHERVDRHFQPAFLGREVRNEPGQRPDFFLRGLRKNKSRVACRLKFDDFGDFDLAHVPMHASSLGAGPSGVDLKRAGKCAAVEQDVLTRDEAGLGAA